jgi:CHAT domain-containing protein/Tfp pilus assembly protein PilF
VVLPNRVRATRPLLVLGPALVAGVLLLPGGCRRADGSAGVVVEEVMRFSGASSVRAGDRLLGWERRSGRRVVARGPFRTWDQVEEVDLLQGPRGGVVLMVLREGRRKRIPVDGTERWWIDARPALDAAAIAAYQRAKDHVAAGRFGDAERETAALAERLSGRDRPWAWRRLGYLARDRGDWARAEEAFRRGAVLATGATRAQLLMEQSLARRRRGLYAAAAELLEEAVALRRARPTEELARAWILVQLANLYERDVDPEAADKALAETLEIYTRAAPASLGAASAHTSLGNLAMSRRDLRAAEASYRESLRISGPGWPAAWINLARVAELRGDLARAEEHLERAAAASSGSAGAKANATWLQIGDVRLRREDWVGARSAYGRFRDGMYRVEPENPWIAFGEVGLCRSARGAGDLAAAAAWCERALAHVRQLHGTSELEAMVLEALGEVALTRGEVESAREHLGAAVGLRRAAAPGTLDLARSLALLARVERRAGRSEAALALFTEALEAATAQEARLGGGELAPVPFRASVGWIAREQVELLVDLGRPADAFAALERSRAQALRSLLGESGHGERASSSPLEQRDRRRLAADLDAAYAKLAGLPSADSRVPAARLRLDEVLARWEGSTAAAPAVAVAKPVGVGEAQRSLPAGSLLLSYSLGPERGLLFALPADGPLRVHPLPLGSKALAPLVERLRQRYAAGSRRDGAELERLGADLTASLLAPAAAEIAGARSLLVVPDAPLQALAFASLPDPASPGQPLVAAHPLQAIASAGVLVELGRRPETPRPWRPLAVVDPEPAAGALATPGGRGLPALRGGRREAAALAALFPTTRVLSGAAASEAAWRRETPDADLLHVAAHAILDERLPLGSALLLSPADGDSGWLHAWELVEGSPLRAELVTLAACDSARGVTLPGEGLLGLTWALQRAGARAVVGSLWPVDDEVTALFMERFYRRLAEGAPKAEALRQAQLDLRRAPVDTADGRRLDLRHPRHWAGFVLIGT